MVKIDLGSDRCTVQRQNVKHVSHVQVLVLAIWAAEVLWTNLWLGLGHKELKEIPVYLTSTKRIILANPPIPQDLALMYVIQYAMILGVVPAII